MLATAAGLLGRCAFFEFRLDSLAEPAAFLPALEAFLDEHPAVDAIATCRRVTNGGGFAGTARDEARVLHAAAVSGASVVDLSVESAEELQADAPEELNILRHSPARLLVSWHDFAGTPDLESVYDRIARFAPALVKIVPTATTLDEALRLLRLLDAHRDEGRLVAMSMGTPGVMTRVLGPRFGSVFTFAAPDAESATAPGQVDFQTMREVYRIDGITGKTRVFGVFGKPVTSSKSPAMLNAAFAACGVDAVYLPLETDDAAELFRVAETLPLAGASVTMPLKEQIVPGLDLDGLAAGIGAANTLVRTAAGALRGYNTDAAGIADPLARRMALEGATVLVLGAGGAARAAVFALRARGAQVAILNRTRERAEALARDAGAKVVTREEAAALRFDAVVNATPHGMRGQAVGGSADGGRDERAGVLRPCV